MNTITTQCKFFSDDVTRQLNRAIRAGADPKELWRDVGERLTESVSRNFEAGGRPPWKPLADSTLLSMRGRALKRKQKGRFALNLRKSAAERIAGKKILTGRGRLRRDIHYKSRGGLFQIGSNLKYARIHQKGGKAGKGHSVVIPKREYLKIQEEDKRGILRVDVPRFLGVGAVA